MLATSLLYIYYIFFNTLPNNKTVVMTKLKECVGDKINVAKMIIALSNKVENTMEKENAGYQHFLLFP